MEIDITDKVNRVMKYIFMGILLLLLSLAGVIFSWQSNHRYVTLSNGQVVGDMVKVKSKVPGFIAEILVGDGESVEAGQVLAKMRVKVLPEQITQLEQSVEMAKVRYQELLTRPLPPVVQQGPQGAAANGAAESALTRAKQEKEKMDKLFAIGGISSVKHKEAEAKYERELQNYQAASQIGRGAASANEPVAAVGKEKLLKIAELQIKQAEAALAQAKEEQVVEIKAAVDGMVYLQEIKVEEELAANQDVFAIGNLREIWLEIPVSEGQKEKLALGQFVQYTIAEYPDQRFCGTVYEIIEPDAALGRDDSQRSLVKISIPADIEIQIKPGMKASAKISV